MRKILDRDGHDEYRTDDSIAVNDEIELRMDYVVRLIKDTGLKKECIWEEVFCKRPTEKQIIWCLMKYKEASFAAVSERYKLDSSEFPFE